MEDPEALLGFELELDKCRNELYTAEDFLFQQTKEGRSFAATTAGGVMYSLGRLAGQGCAAPRLQFYRIGAKSLMSWSTVEGYDPVEWGRGVCPDLDLVTPEWLAENFRGVEYRIHRYFLKQLAYPEAAAAFDPIWELCAPRMEKPHHRLVLEHDPEHWLAHLATDNARRRFLKALVSVVTREANADEARGRPKLATLLRNAAKIMRDSAFE